MSNDESAVLFLQSGPAGQAVSSTENTPCHLASRRSPFSPSLILTSSAHLRPLRMTGAHLFSNAHDIAISGSTFYMANTVSGTVRHPPSKLMALHPLQINIHEEEDMKTFQVDGIVLSRLQTYSPVSSSLISHGPSRER